MLYKRIYKIKWNANIDGAKNSMLNLALKDNSVYMNDDYEGSFKANTQGLQKKITTDTTYSIDVNGIEDGLTFEYRNDAAHTSRQLMKIFPDDGLFPINKKEDITTSERLTQVYGEYVVLVKEYDDEGVPTVASDNYDLITNRYILHDDESLTLKAQLEIRWSNAQLVFVVSWDSDTVARKDAIERRLVDTPLNLMAKIQHSIEKSLMTLDGFDVEDHIIDCKFQAINHSESQCSPDIIQQVKDAKMLLRDEEE